MNRILFFMVLLLFGCSDIDNFDSCNGYENEIKFSIKPNSRILVLGDSISDENCYDKSWTNWFSEETNVIITNVAKACSTYSLYRKNVDEINLNDFEYIFIMGGANNIYFGDKNSICDLKYVCSKLDGRKVVIVNPFSFDNESINMTKQESYEFREEIHNQSIKYGFTYINALGFQYEKIDSIHPSELGCKQLSECMMKALLIK